MEYVVYMYTTSYIYYSFRQYMQFLTYSINYMYKYEVVPKI